MGFLLKLKSKTKPTAKKNVLGEKPSTDAEDIVHQISAFDSKGGQFKGKVVKALTAPAIKLKLNKTLPNVAINDRIAKLSFGLSQSKDKTSNQELTFSENTISDNGDVVLMNSDIDGEDVTDADYESIGVEGFGSAMLRGMGWKGEKNGLGSAAKETSKLIQHRKQGVLLGIGAKPVESEVMEDLRGGSNATFQVPLKRKE